MTMPDIDPQDEAAFRPWLSTMIDRATLQLESCTDDACRSVWRALLDRLEQMLPIGVGERAE